MNSCRRLVATVGTAMVFRVNDTLHNLKPMNHRDKLKKATRQFNYVGIFYSPIVCEIIYEQSRKLMQQFPLLINSNGL